MSKTVRLEGRSARSKRVIREHGDRWAVKETDAKWFTKEIRAGKTISHVPGMRLEAAHCSCEGCVLYGPISHWIYLKNDTEYKIIEESDK